ncbi:MAG: hypothetical protein Q8922_16025 [Bacteroidota bacterium]|nr:hypothetical protein [Bacteroidota bacterium]MDP4233083.1 hypothetical protein [Bacteroidota bacterium]MDP4241772.1 hypothetical protein [Bacteroidota bacterium]MDP4289422.1 hypothetical protein [Bacteroidota bacterium]
MKKTVLSLSIALVVTAASPRTPPPTSVGGGWGVVSPALTPSTAPVPTCYTFTVDNASTDSLGTVTVSGTSSSQDFNVTTTGFYEQNICFAAISATVNGVNVNYPNSGNVQLPSGVWVKVAWQSPSLIEIANEAGTNGPVRQ